MMNKAMNAALNNFHANPSQLKASLFHSTPILERKRRAHWDSSSNQSSRRGKKLHGNQQLLRNMGAFAEHLFQSWKYDRDSYDSSTNHRSTWFRPNSKGNGFKGGKTMKSGPHVYYRRGFEFLEDDDDIDVETLFNSALGKNRNFYYSFIDDEPRWGNSEGYYNNHRFSSNQRCRYQEEYYSNESGSSELDLRSDRLALGLNTSGPLNLEDVKNAYRGCALKWHPDRHQGSSKATAEEKFKVCSAAYQSICNKLSLN